MVQDGFVPTQEYTSRSEASKGFSEHKLSLFQQLRSIGERFSDLGAKESPF